MKKIAFILAALTLAFAVPAFAASSDDNTCYRDGSGVHCGRGASPDASHACGGCGSSCGGCTQDDNCARPGCSY